MEVDGGEASSRREEEAQLKPKPTSVPSSKGHRPWKRPKRRTAAAQRRTSSFKLTLEQKKQRQKQRNTLVQIARAAKEADAAAKQAERERRAEKKKLKEENVLRGTQKLVITNPKKLAKMSKKQYLNYVRKNSLNKQ